MNEEKYQVYKSAKKIEEQLDYLHDKKRVQYNDMDRETAGEKLLEYNYVNIITPFEYQFARLNSNKNMMEYNETFLFERNVEFVEYYNLFLEERNKYHTIINNVQNFELHFKSITAYYILITYTINDSNQLNSFLMNLKTKLLILKKRYNSSRVLHMNRQIDSLAEDIIKYSDISFFFDRMSLGSMLTVFICLDDHVQNKILNYLKKYQWNFNVDKVSDFTEKVFCLVSIRNCVMHCNSLEILIRFYNSKTHVLRKSHNKKKYLKMIKVLSKEKAHD